jgi:hypothetical protein
MTSTRRLEHVHACDNTACLQPMSCMAAEVTLRRRQVQQLPAWAAATAAAAAAAMCIFTLFRNVIAKRNSVHKSSDFCRSSLARKRNDAHVEQLLPFLHLSYTFLRTLALVGGQRLQQLRRRVQCVSATGNEWRTQLQCAGSCTLPPQTR